MRVIDRYGNEVACATEGCEEPATGSWNRAANYAAGAADDFEPACDEHNPFRPLFTAPDPFKDIPTEAIEALAAYLEGGHGSFLPQEYVHHLPALAQVLREAKGGA